MGPPAFLEFQGLKRGSRRRRGLESARMERREGKSRYRLAVRGMEANSDHEQQQQQQQQRRPWWGQRQRCRSSGGGCRYLGPQGWRRPRVEKDK